MVAQAYNCSSRKAKNCRFEASLGYILRIYFRKKKMLRQLTVMKTSFTRQKEDIMSIVKDFKDNDK